MTDFVEFQKCSCTFRCSVVFFRLCSARQWLGGSPNFLSNGTPNNNKNKKINLPKIVAYGTLRRNRLHSAARTKIGKVHIRACLVEFQKCFVCSGLQSSSFVLAWLDSGWVGNLVEFLSCIRTGSAGWVVWMCCRASCQ